MTLYRMASTMLVLSALCLAIALSMGSNFYILCSTICILLAGQLYASGVDEEKAKNPARRS